MLTRQQLLLSVAVYGWFVDLSQCFVINNGHGPSTTILSKLSQHRSETQDPKKQSERLSAHRRNIELLPLDDTDELNHYENGLNKQQRRLHPTAREARIEYPLRTSSSLLCGCGCTTAAASSFASVTATATAFTPASVLAASPSKTLTEYFPTAIPISDLQKSISSTLPSYTRDNTLVATSICADEVNSPLIDSLSSIFNRPFNLGGLAGVPFTGSSGLAACISHVPADGKLLIVIGPHIGFDRNGYIGFVDRLGQETSSTACGAVIGALKLISKGMTDLGDGGRDNQEGFILKELARKMPESVLKSGDEDGKIAYATYMMYTMARDYLKDILSGMSKRPSEVAVLAGVVINRGTAATGMEDLFQPLLFETVDWTGETQTLFGDTFGEKPHLYPVLYGDKAAVKDVVADVDFGPPENLPPPPKKLVTDYFPSALKVTDLLPLLLNNLPGFTKANTLVATSICSDEINFPIVSTLSSQFNQPFVLGGLAGVPFSGVSGMAACMSHVPKDGNLLIILASHVGFDKKSYLGKVNRPGQEFSSGACGAAIGALKVIQAGAASAAITGIATDAQEDYILRELEQRVPERILKGSDMEAKVAFTTYETYAIARDYLDEVLKKQKSMPKEVAVLAGVIINRGTDGEDLFQPLLFQSMKPGEGKQNLYTSAFGGKPYLSLLPIMGGMRDVVQDIMLDLSVEV